ncbi:hypothetical protein M758_4G047100 [Ceratodon purpureus]|nr:hypothetical protein M758_4G047100 [Ceratodon purpureus]
MLTQCNLEIIQTQKGRAPKGLCLHLTEGAYEIQYRFNFKGIYSCESNGQQVNRYKNLRDVRTHPPNPH